MFIGDIIFFICAICSEIGFYNEFGDINTNNNTEYIAMNKLENNNNKNNGILEEDSQNIRLLDFTDQRDNVQQNETCNNDSIPLLQHDNNSNHNHSVLVPLSHTEMNQISPNNLDSHRNSDSNHNLINGNSA